MMSRHHQKTYSFARKETRPDEKRQQADECQEAWHVLPDLDEIFLRPVKFFSDDRIHETMIPRRAA